MRQTLAFLIFLHLTSLAFCQIHITSDQTWDADTVYVDQNVIIDQDATLTINAGTIVFFKDRNYIDVYGQLDIKGLQGDSVTMTAPDNDWYEWGGSRLYYGWGGIYAYGSAKVSASYTAFEKIGYTPHSKNGDVVFGALYNESTSNMTFEHCRFTLKRDKEQTSEGCAIEGTNIVINHSLFKNNKGTGSLIKVSNSGSLTVTNTAFINNDIFGFIINSPSASFAIKGCQFDGNITRALIIGGTYQGTSWVEQNTFRNNLGAIKLRDIFATTYFRNNIYESNGGQIYFEYGNVVIAGNVFVNNHYADPYDFFGNDYDGIVRVENSETFSVTIVNNTFIDNQAMALRMWSVNTFTIANNIFHNNYPEDVSLSLASEWLNTEGRIFQYNLMGQLVAGTGNRSGNPRISIGKEFTLAANSPAINSGNPLYSSYLLTHDVLGNPRINDQLDIGAVEFLDTFVPLTDVNLSETVIRPVEVNSPVATFSTTSSYSLEEVSYFLSDDNGVNNDYFAIEEDKLVLKRTLESESLLRIKVGVLHISGAWLSDYFFLTIAPMVVEVGEPLPIEGRVYPIPADRFLNVQGFASGITKYRIMSTTGAEVASDALTNGVIDISLLSDGMYLLHLSGQNEFSITRFYKCAR
jgi:hypothetical protein